MVEMMKILEGLPDKIIKQVEDLFNKGIEEGLNIDIAMIRAFNPIVAGKDAIDLNKFLRSKLGESRCVETDNWGTEQDFIDPDKVPNDGEFYHVPVTLTVSGVNLNDMYKSVDTLKETAKAQENWIIPSINDHMEDWELDGESGDWVPRVEPKDHEISGFVYGVHGVDLDNGEYAIRGTDMIPMGVPELLENYGVSIGYDANFDYSPGEYKDTQYHAEQTDIRIVHNARMIDQRPSIPQKEQKGKAVGAGYGEGVQKDSSSHDDKGQGVMPTASGQVDPEEKEQGDDIMPNDKEKDQIIEDLKVERDELQLKLDSIDQKSLKDQIEVLETKDQESEKKILDLETKNTALMEDHVELEAIHKVEQDALIVKAQEVFKDKWTEEELRAKPADHLNELIEIATREPEFDKDHPGNPPAGKVLIDDPNIDPVGKPGADGVWKPTEGVKR